MGQQHGSEIEKGDREREERSRILAPPLRIDTANAQAWQGERLLKLTPKAFAVLAYLVDHARQLVTKDELMRNVWAETVVTDGALAACIRALRQALRDDAQQPRYIETVHRRGYRFLKFGVRAKKNVKTQQVNSRGFSPTPNSELPPTRGAWVTVGQCIEQYGAGEAYLPVLEALGRLCRGADGEHVIRGQLQIALKVAQQLLGLAQKTQDRRLLLWAHYQILAEDAGRQPGGECQMLINCNPSQVPRA